MPGHPGAFRNRPARRQVHHQRRRPGHRCDAPLGHPGPTPDLVEQEHAAWTIATELVRATLASATTVAAPFAKGPRAGQPVQARHLSFAAAARIVVATVQAGTATASLPTHTRTAAHQHALRQVATTRVTTDRNRHRPRKIKSSQPFGHAPTDITTRTVPAKIRVCGTTAA